jgi:hypothetical protein
MKRRQLVAECQGGGILALEVRVSQRVDKAVGRLAAGQRLAEGGGVVNVRVDQPPAPV